MQLKTLRATACQVKIDLPERAGYQAVPTMKTAITHDWIFEAGYREMVLEILVELFPEADVYTLQYDPDALRPPLKAGDIRSSRLSFNSREAWKYIEKFDREISRFDFNSYDLVISNSMGPMRWLKKPDENRPFLQIAYLTGYYPFLHRSWDTVRKRLGSFFSRFTQEDHRIYRQADLEYARGIDIPIASSKRTAELMREIYGLNCRVLYPPVDSRIFFRRDKSETEDFFLVQAPLEKGHSIETVLESFQYLKDQLIVIGEGSEKEHWQQICRDNTIFTGSLTASQRAALLNRCRGAIISDTRFDNFFALEALSCGKPVICHSLSSAAEHVSPGENGIVYSSDNPDGLMPAIFEFDRTRFSRRKIISLLPDLGIEAFRAGLRDALPENMKI